VLRADDGDDNLVEVPFVAVAWGSSADAIGGFETNFRPFCRIVSYVTEMPRAARISSTSRKLNENRI
jgi:hypothetical protein